MDNKRLKPHANVNRGGKNLGTTKRQCFSDETVITQKNFWRGYSAGYWSSLLSTEAEGATITLLLYKYFKSEILRRYIYLYIGKKNLGTTKKLGFF